jgi:hypothetical protein
VVDDVTRECLASIADTSISGARIARELSGLIERRGKPEMIVSDSEDSSSARMKLLGHVSSWIASWAAPRPFFSASWICATLAR